MEFKVFPNGAFLVNTVLAWDGETGEAVLFDPSTKEVVEEVEDFADRKGLKVVYVVNTHEHPDHTGANAWAKLTFPEAKLVMHPEAAKNLNFWVESEIGQLCGAEYSPPPDLTVEEGDELKIGNSYFKVLHTPGHSPGSIVLYCPKELSVVGDLIFKDSIGRYDLPMSDFSQLKSSLFKLLKVVDGKAKVIPGHGEITTLDRELQNNPILRQLLL